MFPKPDDGSYCAAKKQQKMFELKKLHNPI